MKTDELYINGKRLDLSANFGVRLNRRLLSPAELNTKDAQFSYSISLPATRTNAAALDFAIVEETRDKFNRVYAAELIVGGVRIFAGLFKLTEVSAAGYKGNLYKPVPKTVRDVFGDVALNAHPELRIDFDNFAESVSAYNLAAATEPQLAIFPMALYGVLPKVPLDRQANNYSDRDVWDGAVFLGLRDLPPSVNVLKMLRHIFEGQGYTLQGTAFDDDKLARLYLSYKNADDYVQPWNYGYQAKMQLSGSWASDVNRRTMGAQWERGIGRSRDQLGFEVYSVDLMDATNSAVNIVEDIGGNVLYREINDADNVPWARTQIRIPASGFYKVRLHASIQVNSAENSRSSDPATGVAHISGRSSHSNNNFNASLYEVKLLRDRGQGDFGLSGAKIDGRYYYDNQPQNTIFDEENIPKYFPPLGAAGPLNFVDLAQNRNLLLGMHVGEGWHGWIPSRGGPSRDFVNPVTGNHNAAMLAAKPAVSWNPAEDTERTLLAMPSLGWSKYGLIGDFDNPDDNPDIDIDYSGATRISGQVLDANGNPQAPATGNLGVRYNDYYLNAVTGAMNPLAGWETSDFIDLRAFEDVTFSAAVAVNAGGAVTTFYDDNRQFIGAGILAPDTTPASYTSQPVNAPVEAAFVRISGDLGAVTINGINVATSNVIMHRFALQRYYTYVLTANAPYEGVAFVHVNGETSPALRVPFVGGVAEFTTGFYPLTTVTSIQLTMYLATHEYGIDGPLTISRRIDDNSDAVIGWEDTNKYAITVNNAPTSYVQRGTFNGVPADANWNAETDMYAVIWLEAGELLSVASVTSEGRYRRSGQHSTYGMVRHRIDWELSVQPFRVDPDWLKVDLVGNGTAPMNWNDPVNFDTDSIDLVGFLSADMKTNEFIDNFVKAFNLQLTQTADNAFALNVKQQRRNASPLYVDLDGQASVRDRINTPLGLPSVYKLGYTVDKEEQGYIETGDDGGGEYPTGVPDGATVEQTSSFSMNWFKPITKVESGGNVTLPLPIISKADVWAPSMAYPDAMGKRYTDLAYRFWYFDGQLNDLGATFDFNGAPLVLAKVSDRIPDVSILNYKNQQHTILDNYFTLLINGASHYTEAELYLTVAQYERLNGAVMARFNGDLYYIAEVSGYDPSGRNKTKLKLIRRI